MKKNIYTLNTILALVLGLALLAAVLVRTFAPRIILPRMTVHNLALISLIALVAEHYAAPGAKRCYPCVFLFGALTFGLLPFTACMVNLMDAGKLALLGGGVFTVLTWLFTSIQDRLSTGPVAKAAPVFSALGLYLALQCFAGMGL